MNKSTSCGLFNWRPKWGQKFANQKVYLFLFAVIGVIQSMSFTYLTSVLSTIEKRFGLKSKEATWIYSGNEISQICFIAFLPFVGRVKRRPLFMGLSIMLSALGLLIIAFPHFTGNQTYLHDSNQQVTGNDSSPQSQVCNANQERIKAGECDGNQSQKDWTSLAIVFIGIFLLGFGVSFYFSFGIPYMDDNTERSNSPLALSIVMSARVIGPTLGYSLASACLAVYAYPGQAPNDIIEGHPRWIGAWWIGFVVVAILLMLFAPWLTLFPSRFNKTGGETDATRISKDETKEAEDDPSTATEWFEELKSVSKRLASSKVYVLNNISGAAFLFGIMGFALFVPKYIEFHFRMKASVSGATGGVPKTVASVIGMLLSGWIVGRWRFKARTLAGWCLVADIFAIIGMCSIALFTCPPSHFPNVNSDGSQIILSDCNRDCNCQGIPYNPVCDEETMANYFSPCHAGCDSFQKDNNGTITYTDCKCLVTNALSAPSTSSNFKQGSVTSGTCPVDCSGSFTALICTFVVFAIIGSTTRIPNFLLSLRSIDLKDKSASLTLSVSFLSLFAFLPSPLIYGALLDKTCVLWDKTKCGETTHCLIYDTDAMRNILAFMPAAFFALATLADFGVFLYCKDLTIYDTDADEEAETNGKDHELSEKGFKEIDLHS